ncbi:hypothetical protein FD755_019957 [Muntiacus reevesi]|uniref:Uncharacterized protein n=1 Tax=Muntiacus reevesi TaxID=9886 RepID=A0A5N3X3K1_MUNRE|nr:hypothetical protein FD755_019957 [Muntiacus reevesi]
MGLLTAFLFKTVRPHSLVCRICSPTRDGIWAPCIGSSDPSDFSYLPVADTFSTHGTTIGSADVFLRFRQPHENFRFTHASESAWAHTTCGFWCFPNLLGVKVNNSITRGSGPRK